MLFKVVLKNDVSLQLLLMIELDMESMRQFMLDSGKMV
jgi:hypothetical protein